MSIKRSREVTRRRAPDRDDSYRGKKEPERVYSWDTDVAAHAGEPFVAYAATHRFAKDTRLEHKVFGKGIVTRVEGTKIEVLFKEGTKKLAHNPTGTDATAAAGAAPAPAAAAPATAPAPEAAPPKPAEPEPVMKGIVWSFGPTAYATQAEFEAAVIAYHAQKVGTHVGRFDPAAIVLTATRITVTYEALRGPASDDALTVGLSSTDAAGFRQGELLYKLHQALVLEKLGEQHSFEGLLLSGNEDPPNYLLLQGS